MDTNSEVLTNSGVPIKNGPVSSGNVGEQGRDDSASATTVNNKKKTQMDSKSDRPTDSGVPIKNGPVSSGNVGEQGRDDSASHTTVNNRKKTQMDSKSDRPTDSGVPIKNGPVSSGNVGEQGRDDSASATTVNNRKKTQMDSKSDRPTETMEWDRFKTKVKENISKENKQFWDKVFVITKIIVAMLLFLLTLVTTVVSKICFVIISANMLPPAFTNGTFYRLKTANMTLTYPDIKDINNKTILGATNVLWIWAMITCIGAPSLFIVLRNFWKKWVQLGGREPTPCSTIFLVLLVETIHTIGLCITVFVVVPNMDPISGLLITLCMGVIPGFLKVVYPTVRKNEQNSGRMRYTIGRIINVFGAGGQLLSLAVWCWHVYVNFDETFDNIAYFACVVFAPIFNSIHWWENFVREGSTKDNRLSLLARHIQENRTKLSLYSSIWKMVLIVLIPMVIFGVPCEHGLDCVNVLFFKKKNAKVYAHIADTNLVSDKFFGECNDHLPIVIAAIGAFCSGVSFKLGKIACRIMTQVVDFSLPLLLSTPATIGLIFVMYDGFMTTHNSLTATVGCTIPFPQWTTPVDFFASYTTEYKSMLSVIAGLLSFLTILIITHYIWYPGTDRLQRTDKLFVQPLYCGVMTDISLMLNRRQIEKKSKQSTFNDNKGGFRCNCCSSQENVSTDPETPFIYMCATMWHETELEMAHLLKSVFRMDNDQSARKEVQNLLHETDPDYYEFEAHIFFDDAFEMSNRENKKEFDTKVNDYVKKLVQTVQTLASAIIGNDLRLRSTKVGTPYGGRLEWTLPGGNKLIAHLKDKTVIRHRKRWSQVMYMYYFLGYHLNKDKTKSLECRNQRAMNIYLLALDGDVNFYPNAVQLLVDRMKKNPKVGAACGRIHPIGNGAMVWYQKFEYAVSHWLQKAAEDKLGCVLCSPGCFSLFRGSALMDENVMNKYTTPSSQPRHHVQYDQGEDRWLCTLLLQQGYKVEYCAAADALTYAPEGFYEFFQQRRRWMPSTMANIMDLLADWKNITEKNPDISLLYVLYQGLLMVSSILTPGTIFLMIVGAINMAYQHLSLYWALVLNGVPMAIMVFLCFIANNQKQLTYAAILSTLYSLVMMVVIVGLLVQAAEYGICSVTTMFISFVGGVFVMSALMHPQEFWCIIHGFIYFLAIPSMSMILMIYSMGNLHVVSWGTRENVSGEVDTMKAKKKSQLLSIVHYIGQLLLRSSDVNTNGAEVEAHRPEQGSSQRSSDMRGARETSSDALDNHVHRDHLEKRLTNHYWMNDGKTFKWSEEESLTEDEVKFWEQFIEKYLLPIETNKESEEEMAAKLIELRNKVCLIFILINALFITIVFTLQQVFSTGSLSLLLPCANPNVSQEERQRKSVEPISVAFTLVFGILLLVQFLCMLMHRMATLLHICASTEIFKKKGDEKIMKATSKSKLTRSSSAPHLSKEKRAKGNSKRTTRKSDEMELKMVSTDTSDKENKEDGCNVNLGYNDSDTEMQRVNADTEKVTIYLTIDDEDDEKTGDFDNQRQSMA